MSRKALGSTVTALGLVLLAISALADQIGIGDEEDFGWSQIAGVVVGIAIVVVGFLITRRGERSAG